MATKQLGMQELIERGRSFSRILIPLDLSDYSKLVLQKCSELFRAGPGNEFHFLYVWRVPSDGVGWGAEDPEDVLQDHLSKLITEYFNPSRSACVELVIVFGDASLQIARYAENHHCDLVVIPTHERKGLWQRLSGSTAAKVVKQVKCPVLTLYLDDGLTPIGNLIELPSRSRKPC